MQIVSQLLNVSSADPEDARRRKLLNILLLGTAALTGSVLLAMLVITFIGPTGGVSEEILVLLLAIAVVLVGIGIIYAINRYGAGWLASSLFLLLLTAAFVFSDTPQEITNGRTLFLFAIPVIMASVLLRPYASFIAAAMVGVMLLLIGQSANVLPSAPAIPGFFVLALVSWLSARSLEHALLDLRAINRELDQRVMERTRELAEALERVQAEASKNQAILEGIADGVIVFDVDGKAIVANPALTQLVDRPVERIIGQDIMTLMSDEVSADDRAMITELLKAETLHSGVKLQWGKRMLSISFALVRDAAGGAIGTVAVFRDFTREAELDRMKSTFVSMASHELRTPLTAILGYADMLLEQVYGPLADGQRMATQRIVANGRRMLNLVNNLLDRAQIEAGQLWLRYMPFSPASLIENVQSVMSVLAESKGLAFICTIADDVPDTLNGDSQRLEQILINLAGNAIKFTEQGEVSVRIFQPNPARWALQVADTGPGIPEDAQTYIFNPFRQVDDPVTRKHPGSGLGLSIVKQIATLMGGDVTLESAVGKGSTFTVTLPLYPTQEGDHEQADSAGH